MHTRIAAYAGIRQRQVHFHTKIISRALLTSIFHRWAHPALKTPWVLSNRLRKNSEPESSGAQSSMDYTGLISELKAPHLQTARRDEEDFRLG
jgi:hypothetical protein